MGIWGTWEDGKLTHPEGSEPKRISYPAPAPVPRPEPDPDPEPERAPDPWDNRWIALWDLGLPTERSEHPADDLALWVSNFTRAYVQTKIVMFVGTCVGALLVALLIIVGMFLSGSSPSPPSTYEMCADGTISPELAPYCTGVERRE